ncbi:hypothetical protein ALC60_00094 [Trachymyrmex zeteki]|nr:hypothetical protein ALC60_00094 [Trachymyrmex zeteki]
MESNKDHILLAIFTLVIKFKQSISPFKQEIQRRKILFLHALYEDIRNKEKDKQRQFWVRPIFNVHRRFLQGASENLVKEMEFEDETKFRNYFRMDSITFKKLLELIGPLITKQSVVREPIPPETRLHITLRYLALGDSMMSISYAFRVAHNTVSKIIAETCNAIWNVLKEIVFLKDEVKNWQNIAADFDYFWNYPNCIGCIDGKHVELQVLVLLC